MQRTSVPLPARPVKTHSLWKRLVKNRWLYLLALPGLLFFILFKYIPLAGLVMAFQQFSPALGFFKSKFVGFEHFRYFFTSPEFGQLFYNTFRIAINNLVFFFPLPIILALMLNSLRIGWYKRLVQTITYMPHFLSWVIIASICYVMMTTEDGVINEAAVFLGGQPIPFLTSEQWFRPLILLQSIWRETGWGTIIFLAALSNVDPQLYDAAQVDGANAWQRTIHITLPAISATIITLLILRLGSFLDTGFSQIFLMLNSMNREVGEVFDTYVYRLGLGKQGGRFSYTAAVGMFKSLVGFLLVFGSDRLAKKLGGDGIL